MRVTKLAAGLILCALPVLSMATTDKECLNHLGGAFADVECYNGLSNDIIEENKALLKQIVTTIPKGNKSKQLLTQYDSEQHAANKYCELSRDSLTKWVYEKKQGPNPRYEYQDVAYYECVYGNLLHQNKFLKGILDNTSEK